MNTEMNPYLPSKTFLYRTIVIVVLALALFGIYKLSIFFINKFSKKQQSSLTVSPGGTIEKDSNGNGIPDWEETLWGLDPTKDGDSNKAIIEKDKAALAQAGDTSTSRNSNKTSDENDLVSQEFFTAVMSLQTSGNIDDQSLQAVADAIGQKVSAEPIADEYSPNDVKTDDFTVKNTDAYLAAMKNLFIKYQNKDIGDELTFISQGIENNDPTAMKVAVTVAASYRAFSKEAIKIPVPKPVAQNHLDLVNNYEKVAETIEGMSQELTDPIVAMKALINYKKYNDLVVSEIKYLSGLTSI